MFLVFEAKPRGREAGSTPSEYGKEIPGRKCKFNQQSAIGPSLKTARDRM